MNDAVGIVVIGRNEGERLNVCLRSALLGTNCVVYVDSGSTDESLLLAKRQKRASRKSRFTFSHFNCGWKRNCYEKGESKRRD